MNTQRPKILMGLILLTAIFLFTNGCTNAEPTIEEEVNNQEAAQPTETPLAQVDPTPTVEPQSSDMTPYFGSTWLLLHTIVGGDAIVPPPPIADTYLDIFIRVGEDLVVGYLGCNEFTGAYTLDGNEIRFKDLTVTDMPCEKETVELYETAVFEILNNTTTYEINGNILQLLNADGLPLAEYILANFKTLYVGPEMVECEGAAPQMCLLVKEDPDAAYELFYDNIDGFEWEAGYEYMLEVSVIDVLEPLADASSLQYRLSAVVSKTAVSD